MTKKDGGHKAQKVILAIGIAIILAFFVNLGIEVFYESPEYEDYCDIGPRLKVLTEEECVTNNSTWIENSVGPNYGYCAQDEDSMRACSAEFEEDREEYSKVVFIVTLLIGIIIIGVSIALKVVAVSSGLMAGGILVMITGLMEYWRYSDDILRFSILGLILAILVWIGYKKLK